MRQSKNMDNTIREVKHCISRLQGNFMRHSASYFNESDLQCELYALLLAHFGDACEVKNIFVWGTGEIKETRQCITRRLHSELLLPEGRIDLAILDLSHVRFAINPRGKFGYIQLEEGEHIFIEIKASRTSRSSISSKSIWQNLILSDIAKLNQYPHKSFMLCFDFSGLLNDDLVSQIDTATSSQVELIYARNEFKDNYFVTP